MKTKSAKHLEGLGMRFEEWQEKRLGEVINLKRGYDLPVKKRINGKNPIISSSGVNGYHNESKVKAPGVITGRSGLLGQVYYTENDFWPLNTSLYVEDFKGNNPLYIYYLLKTMNLGNYNAGSSVPTLNRNHVHLLKVKIPNRYVQDKIGVFLYNFERKIKLNNSIISTLEELAQTLFKRWFVDFEFPNEEGKPYKSSGGKMVESELGMIPAGWKISDLKDVMKQVGETVKVKRIESKSPHIGLAHMPQNSIALNSWESSEEIASNKTSFNKGDILFGKLRPYFKKVGIAPLDGICSTDILVLNSIEQQYYSYLLCVLTNDSFITYCTATVTGTRMPRTGWRQMSKFKIIKPTIKLANDFNDLTGSFYIQILNKVIENKKLEELRDTLLPKLLSGEIELPEDSEVTDDVPIP